MFTVYEGKFKKTDGNERNMEFVRLKDLPVQFLAHKLKGNSRKTQRTLGEGMELVYDVQAENFRIFNWKTVIGEVKEKKVERLTEDKGKGIKNLDSFSNPRKAEEGSNDGN